MGPSRTPLRATSSARLLSPRTRPPRAMWVWTADDPEQVVAFALARGVTTLFVAVPPRVTTSAELPRLQELGARARANDIQLDALGGEPGWAEDPQWVLSSWLAPTLSTGLFSGVHVDVEPYLLPSWATDRAGAVRCYLSLLSMIVTCAGPAHPVEADIPFWFSTVSAGNRSTLERAVLTTVAGGTVMAYRNHALGSDGTLDVTSTALATAAALDRPLRIGQETNDLGSDPAQAKQTFHGMTLEQLDDELHEVDDALAGRPGYAGVAVQDYRGWASMAP